MLVNKRGLADVLGVSERTLTEWQKDGLPISVKAERGGENQYDTTQAIKWMVDKQIERMKLVSPKDRLDNLRADEIEVRLAKDAGLLINSAECELIWVSLITSARVDLQQFVDDIKSKLRGKGIEPDEFSLDEGLKEVLDRLADQELIDEGDESESEGSLSDDA